METMELKVDVWSGTAGDGAIVAMPDYRPGTGAGAYWDTETLEFSLRREGGPSVWTTEETVRDFLRALCGAKNLPQPNDRNEVVFNCYGMPMLMGRHLYAISLRTESNLRPAELQRLEQDLIGAVCALFEVPKEAFAMPRPFQQQLLVSPDAPKVLQLARAVFMHWPAVNRLKVWMLDCDTVSQDERGNSLLGMVRPIVSRAFIPISRWQYDPSAHRNVCSMPNTDLAGIPGLMELEVLP
jgi:hypothetical protein